MNILEDIKKIIFDFIVNEYNKYLNNNKILIIKSENIENIIKEFYENNTKYIKTKIRHDLKEKYNEKYPNGSVENIILDIFQNKNNNINKIIDEIKIIQKKNFYNITLPIINNSLNLNIKLVDNYIVINSTNTKNIDTYLDLYNDIDNYKFIYSINNIILDEIENDKKIHVIKSEIKDKETIELGLYYLKNK